MIAAKVILKQYAQPLFVDVRDAEMGLNMVHVHRAMHEQSSAPCTTPFVWLWMSKP